MFIVELKFKVADREVSLDSWQHIHRSHQVHGSSQSARRCT